MFCELVNSTASDGVDPEPQVMMGCLLVNLALNASKEANRPPMSTVADLHPNQTAPELTGRDYISWSAINGQLNRGYRHFRNVTDAMASTIASREAGFVRWVAKPASRLRWTSSSRP